MSTIALYAMSLSRSADDPFREFVPRWWAAVSAMRPLPDQIVIACGCPDFSGIEAIPESLESRTKIVCQPVRALNELLNVAIRACDTKWVAWSGLDDVMLPDAFADLPAADAAGAAIIVGGVRWLSGGSWAGSWSPRNLRNYNTLPACSPHTKELWERVGGYPAEQYFADWAFWAKVASSGPVSVFDATRPQMIFDDGATRATLSGASADQAKKDFGRQQFYEYCEALT